MCTCLPPHCIHLLNGSEFYKLNLFSQNHILLFNLQSECVILYTCKQINKYIPTTTHRGLCECIPPINPPTPLVCKYLSPRFVSDHYQSNAKSLLMVKVKARWLSGHLRTRCHLHADTSEGER